MNAIESTVIVSPISKALSASILEVSIIMKAPGRPLKVKLAAAPSGICPTFTLTGIDKES